MNPQLFRSLPSVDAVLGVLRDHPAPRPLVKELVVDFLDQLRAEIKAGAITSPEALTLDALAPRLNAWLERGARPKLRRVLNGTGVVVHTNLGRSILAPEAAKAASDAALHYSNLEFDLGSGKRGSRYSLVEDMLCRLSGAEAGLAVNNNAAAVLLVLDTLAKGREAIVSRGELVEIGGSFRIPEVMARSGAKLVEVGCTNRTHYADFETAITDDTAVLMKVHASNYRIVGFTEEVPLAELAKLGQARRVAVYEDLGSGNFFDFTPYGMGFETTVQASVATGADVVTFSGDKVLGGPQAGLIVGKRAVIDRIKKNQLLRALRIDKMTLAALEATLRLHLDPETARAKIPTLAMITANPTELAAKADALARFLKGGLGDGLDCTLVPNVSRVGGGAFPERDLPTTLVALHPRGGLGAETLKGRLLATDPPLVGRIEDDLFHLDPRTLDESEFHLTLDALRQALAN